MPTQLTIVF